MTSPLEKTDPEIAGIIERELERQNTTIQLIASENFTSPAVLEAQGSVLTNKYSEGYPAKRYYGGNLVVDEAENVARDRACALFGSDHANVLSIGARIVAPELAEEIARIFLETPFEGGRHQRRLDEISNIEVQEEL